MQGGKLFVTLILFLLLAPFLSTVRGQRSAAYYLEPEHHKALELFDKEKYAAAQTAFEQVVEAHAPNNLIRIAAEYYSARCAMALYNRDAEEKMRNFVEGHPDSPWLTDAHYQIGRYYYQKNRYEKAIAAFSKVELQEVNDERRVEIIFKKGHAQFNEEQFEKASQAFYKIKDGDHAYHGPANYYYAHIAYHRKNHKTALDHFKRIEDHPKFKGIVPYYLTQIHYLLEDYKKVIEMAPPFLDSAGTERPTEIARIIGDAYYRTGKYASSIPYLRRYIENSYGVNREDRYQMGFALKKAGKDQKALKHFEKVVDRKDSLAQIAYYHMGELYLDIGEKDQAQNAYRSASRFKKNERIREDALFQYAKLAYERSYDPFDQAINALKTYLKEYPDSDRKEKALEYLAQLYMSSKDRDAALASMERIKDKTPRIRTAYQIVAYDKAVNLYLKDRFPKAIESFKKSRKYTLKRDLTAKSHYWQAKCYAEMDRAQKALKAFEKFRRKPGAFELRWYNRSYYDAGYVLFRDSAYKEAATEFRKFTEAASKKDYPQEIADAYQRTGDAYYLVKDYPRATRFYKKAVSIEKGKARDRALYQLAICQGLKGSIQQKIGSLDRLIKEMPRSSFLPRARLELGKTLVKTGEKEKALTRFRTLIEKRPKSVEGQKARLQAGLILYQRNENEKALSQFKKVVESKISHELSKEGLNRIRNIHVESGNMEAYNNYVEGLQGFDVDKEKMDEANYRSAENLYLDEKYEEAAKAFKRYLDRSASPNYGNNARFYRAKALLKSKDSSRALRSFKSVIQKDPNRFSLPAIEEASSLAFELDSFDLALRFYRALEKKSNSEERTFKALLGQMRSLKLLKGDSAAAGMAEKVLGHPDIRKEERVEALMIKGKGELAKEAFPKARSSFQKVVDTTSSEAKAEARYSIAKCYFQEGKYQKAESTIYELVHQKPSYKKWVAKGFLLLADAYREMEKRFQAKETLKSLIDSYEGKSIVKKAEKKLKAIKKAEQKAKRTKKDSIRPDTLRMETDTLKDR
ncbi:MAG: tetratricopeptide repeat protein [Flavobacteriales bacterium]